MYKYPYPYPYPYTYPYTYPYPYPYPYTYPNRYATQKVASALTPTIVILKHTHTVPHARGYTHKHARTHARA